MRGGRLPRHTPLLDFFGILAETDEVDRAVADGLIPNALTLGVCPGVDLVPARRGAWLAEGCSAVAAETCVYEPVPDGRRLLADSQEGGDDVPLELGRLVSTKSLRVGDVIRWNYRELPGGKTAFRTLPIAQQPQ